MQQIQTVFEDIESQGSRKCIYEWQGSVGILLPTKSVMTVASTRTSQFWEQKMVWDQPIPTLVHMYLELSSKMYRFWDSFVSKMLWVMFANPCIPTWEFKNPMEY
jgi:hypothetical protein